MTTSRGLRAGEALFGGGVLALGLFVGIETGLMRVTASVGAVGPKLFPYLIASGLVVIGLLVLRQAFFGHIAHEGGIEIDGRAILLVSLGLVLDFLLIDWVGWIVAATLLFVLVARAFGSRRIGLDLLIGLVLGGLTFVIFNWGLDLSLPTGSLFEALMPDA